MKIKKIMSCLLIAAMMITASFSLASCSGEKNITVIAREKGSGTREAFDRVVTDGTHFLQEKDENGKTVYNTTDMANELTSTGAVLSAVANDKNSIGYISLGSVNDTVNVLKVGGVAPSAETVLDGSYKIQRPFVIMTNSTTPLTPAAQDFMNYLKSAASEEHAKSAGCIFLSNPAKRANEGKEAIEVENYSKLSELPSGKIVIRGSTSMEKFINASAKGYADLYGAKADDIFDIQLEGSSIGRKAAENDTTGNVIGLSSAAVSGDKVNSFNVCLDAVAVIVHKENTKITDLTLAQLYDIFSGKITKFDEI